MEILNPAKPEVKPEPFEPHPTEDKTPNLKHIEFLSHLGLKDQILDEGVMDKIQFIAEKMEFSDFQDLALRLGEDSFTPKLDRIYTYVNLIEQNRELEKKKKLINDALTKYN